MKKIFAAIIVSLAVFSLSGCAFVISDGLFGSAKEPEAVSVSNEEKAEYIREVAGPKTLKFFEEYNEEDGYFMSCTANASGVELSLTSAAKGDKSYVNVEQNEGSYSIITKDGKMYMLEPASKRAYVTDSLSLDFGSYMEEAKDMIYASTYSEGEITIDGIKYLYEGYESEAGKVRYCFLGNDFKYLTVDNGAQYVAIKVNELSKDVDESLFEIPEDYRIR